MDKRWHMQVDSINYYWATAIVYYVTVGTQSDLARRSLQIWTLTGFRVCPQLHGPGKG